MAFPQCLLSTSDVIVAIAEGRYKPAAKPTPNRPQRISHKLVAKATVNIATPTPAIDRIIANRCVERDANKPDNNSPTK